ncbi:MAG: imidazoleglycerol-phosphate dehydratase HisB [Clostridia bacterium]|jgi:imidazoleglycerol-phosphate dehydratase|nr:imidazoleglycerol-phosphate dehydratase HisB [Clostridiaceae bacterium]
MERKATIRRKTKETEIVAELNIDGTGSTEIRTGIGFFDHMLTLLGVHGRMDLKITAAGDIDVDGHHTVEDTGIVLGTAIKEALKDKSGIARYGCCYMPMDEALSRVVVDISNRPYLVMNVSFPVEKIGNMDTELFEEFFKSMAFHAGITLHMETLYGKNSHHIAESLFKGLGHALRQAWTVDAGINGVLSSKGTL